MTSPVHLKSFRVKSSESQSPPPSLKLAHDRELTCGELTMGTTIQHIQKSVSEMTPIILSHAPQWSLMGPQLYFGLRQDVDQITSSRQQGQQVQVRCFTIAKRMCCWRSAHILALKSIMRQKCRHFYELFGYLGFISKKGVVESNSPNVIAWRFYFLPNKIKALPHSIQMELKHVVGWPMERETLRPSKGWINQVFFFSFSFFFFLSLEFPLFLLGRMLPDILSQSA